MKRGSFLRRMRRQLRRLIRPAELDLLREALGRIEARQLFGPEPDSGLRQYEFRVYSQAGEDGIIQYLIRNVAVPRPFFVEFGVEDYRQANTRFLALHNQWAGFVMDPDEENIRAIHADLVYWRFDVHAVQAFVTRENVNRLLSDHGVTGEIGLLSIDIDGNDYWVWDSIDVINPAIVVIEYNYRFGPERSVSVPYDPAFDKAAAHPSGIYFGASLRALERLGRRKGYVFVGCNSFGVNAFFVRGDLIGDRLKPRTVDEGYAEGSFREALAAGKRAYIGRAAEQRILSGLPVVEVEVSPQLD